MLQLFRTTPSARIDCHSLLEVFDRRAQLGLRQNKKNVNKEKKAKGAAKDKAKGKKGKGKKAEGGNTKRCTKRRGLRKLRSMRASNESLRDKIHEEEEQPGLPEKPAKAPKAKASPKAKGKPKAKPAKPACATKELRGKAKAKAKARAQALRDDVACAAATKGKAPKKPKNQVAEPEQANHANAVCKLATPEDDLQYMLYYAKSIDSLVSGDKAAVKAELKDTLPKYDTVAFDCYWGRFGCGVYFVENGKKHTLGSFTSEHTPEGLVVAVATAVCLDTCLHGFHSKLPSAMGFNKLELSFL